MKTILITGASGFLGHNIVKALLERNDTKIIAVLGRPEDKANNLPQSSNLIVCPCENIFKVDFGHIDTLIHTAFSRGDNLSGLTSSLTFTKQVIDFVNNNNVDSVINISTQGVYKGLIPGEAVSEEGPIEPNTAYGLSKWGVENMFEIGCQKQFTNIRMASLSTNARFLDFFVNSIKNGIDITVTAPKQFASIMDVSDAVRGILAVEEISLDKRHHVYNLGPCVQYSILEYAETANQTCGIFGYKPVKITVDDHGKDFAICMDCSRLIEQTQWVPLITKQNMIETMFKN